MDGTLEAILATEGCDKFNNATHRVEGRNFQYVSVVEIEHTFIGVFHQ